MGENIRVENWCGYDIRFVEHDGNWYAVLKDICDALRLQTRDVKDRIECDHLIKTAVEQAFTSEVGDSHIRSKGDNLTRQMLCVDEAGIYQALSRSTRLEARKFIDWISHSLVDLRKTVGLEAYEALKLTDTDVMNTETFNKLLDELDGNSLETLKQKNAKYASADDCLHNFESGAEIMGSTPAQCAWGYMTKHLVALRDKVERDDFSDRDDLLEKCQDIINYIRFIWLIGNDREAEKVMDEIVEDLKAPVLDYSCESCIHYSADGLLNESSPCWQCISGMSSDGKDMSPPSNFVRKEN